MKKRKEKKFKERKKYLTERKRNNIFLLRKIVKLRVANDVCAGRALDMTLEEADK